MENKIPQYKRKMLSATISALSSALPKLNKQFTNGALFLKKSVMANSPAYPLIVFSTTQSVKVCHCKEQISRIRISDYQYQGDEQLIYDARGNKWMFSYGKPSFTLNFWTELRNPEYDAPLDLKMRGAYNLSELREIFYELLRKKDDVLTEHESETYLKTLFEKSGSFDEILNILKKYVFEVNEPELWQEQENREVSGSL